VSGLLRSSEDVVAPDDAADVQQRVQFWCVLHQPRRRHATSLGPGHFSIVQSCRPNPADVLPGDRRRPTGRACSQSPHDWSVAVLM